MLLHFRSVTVGLGLSVTLSVSVDVDIVLTLHIGNRFVLVRFLGSLSSGYLNMIASFADSKPPITYDIITNVMHIHFSMAAC